MTGLHLEELIGKYAEGTATEAEVRELTLWYRKQRIEGVRWPSVNPAEKDAIFQRLLTRSQKELHPAPVRRMHFYRWKVAAVMLLLAGITFLLLYNIRPSGDDYITVKNPSGHIRMVTLPDSSYVWLNASSTLRYNKTFKETRETELAGEAFFQVRPSAEHPFTVRAGGVQATVLGTSFNIRAHDSSATTSVSVISGKVSVSGQDRVLDVLAPTEQLLFNRLAETFTTIIADTNAVLAWKNGRLLFQGETFAEIARSVEAWYGVHVEFASPGMRSCRYYMSFNHSAPIEKLLSTMSVITETQYSFNRKTNTIVLSGKECGP
jgi:ferric-dicitrate binding protein FerR (iron transport regulator)